MSSWKHVQFIEQVCARCGTPFTLTFKRELCSPCHRITGGAEANRPERQERAALFGNSCAYCGKPYQAWDHVYPRNAKHPRPEKLRNIHHLGNLVPVCTSCNSSKGNSDLVEWYEWSSRFDLHRLARIIRNHIAPRPEWVTYLEQCQHPDPAWPIGRRIKLKHFRKGDGEAVIVDSYVTPTGIQSVRLDSGARYEASGQQYTMDAWMELLPEEEEVEA